MKFRWVLAGIIGLFAVILNSCTTTKGGPITGTGFMWVTTQGDQLVTPYNINLTTGAVSQVGSSVATGLGPIAIAITPAGDALFVANRDDNTISAYSVSSGGGLTAQGTPVKAGELPVGIAVDPSGAFLFVASQGNFADPISGTVSVFDIKTAGLTPVGAVTITNAILASNLVAVTAANTFVPGEVVRLEGLTSKTYLNNQTVAVSSATATQFTFNFTHAPDALHAETGTASQVFPTVVLSGTGTGPAAIAVAPVGNFLYVANQFTSTVSIFSYDSSGTLTAHPTSPIVAGTNPAGLAFSRCAGTTQLSTNCPAAAPPAFLFVANAGANTISIFSACIQITSTCPSANGTLTQAVSPPVGAGIRPISFMVNPARDLVYAVDNGSSQVSEYHYSLAAGALTPLSPTTASTGVSPLPGGITTDGNWVFVPNNGGSSVSAYGVGTAGQLNVGTAITLLGQPSAVLIR